MTKNTIGQMRSVCVLAGLGLAIGTAGADRLTQFSLDVSEHRLTFSVVAPGLAGADEAVLFGSVQRLDVRADLAAALRDDGLAGQTPPVFNQSGWFGTSTSGFDGPGALSEGGLGRDPLDDPSAGGGSVIPLPTPGVLAAAGLGVFAATRRVRRRMA